MAELSQLVQTGVFEYTQKNTKELTAVFNGVELTTFHKRRVMDPEYSVEYAAQRLFIYTKDGLESFKVIEPNVVSHIQSFYADDSGQKRKGTVVDGAIQWSEFEPL